jgi:hypothetical protein
VVHYFLNWPITLQLAAVAVSLIVDVLKLANIWLKIKLKMQANTSYGVLGDVGISFCLVALWKITEVLSAYYIHNIYMFVRNLKIACLIKSLTNSLLLLYSLLSTRKRIIAARNTSVKQNLARNALSFS